MLIDCVMSEPTEELSKNAQKKLAKAEEAAKKKLLKDQEKAAKAAEQPHSSSKAVVEEEILDPTQYYESRLRMIGNLEVIFCFCFCFLFLILKILHLHNVHRNIILAVAVLTTILIS